MDVRPGLMDVTGIDPFETDLFEYPVPLHT